MAVFSLLENSVIPALSQYPGISLIAKLVDGVGCNYLCHPGAVGFLKIVVIMATSSLCCVKAACLDQTAHSETQLPCW